MGGFESVKTPDAQIYLQNAKKWGLCNISTLKVQITSSIIVTIYSLLISSYKSDVMGSDAW